MSKKIGRTLIKGTFFFTIARIATVFSTILSSILLARYLGSSGYGLWILANSVFGFLVMFGSLPGTDHAIIKYVSQYDTENKPAMIRIIISTSLKLRIISIGTCCVAAYLLRSYVANSIFNSPELTIILPVLIIGHAFVSLDLEKMFTALKKFQYAAFLRILDSMLNLSFLVLFLILLKWGVIGVAVALMFTSVITSLISFFLALRFLPSSESCTEGNSFLRTSKTLLSFGVPSSFAILLTQFKTYLRNFVIEYVESVEVLGYFTVAFGFYQILHGLTNLVTEPLFPVISELHARNDWARIGKVLSILLKYMLLLAGITIIFIEFFATEIINLVYSESFIQSAVFMRMLTILIAPTIFFVLVDTVFKGIGRSDIILYIDTLSFVWIVFGGSLLILNFGVFGAAIAYLTQPFIMIPIYLYSMKKTLRNIPFRFKPLLRTFPILIVDFIFVFLTRHLVINALHLFLFSLSFLLGSLILAYFMRILNKEEIETLKDFLPRTSRARRWIFR